MFNNINYPFLDEPFCFLIVRIAIITKNICGSQIPTHAESFPLAIKVFANILVDRYIAKTKTDGKSLAYLFCLGLSLLMEMARRADTTIAIQLFIRENNSAI